MKKKRDDDVIKDKLSDYQEKELKYKPLKNIIPDYPSHWKDVDFLSFKTSIYNTAIIDLDSEEAKEVITKVNEAQLEDLKVVRIERVQNLAAYQKYMTEKDLLQNKYDEEFQLEKQLFHGTKITDPHTLLASEEGFDMRFSNKGMWGNGVYFADSLRYSDAYAFHPIKNSWEIKQVFLARVLTGNEFRSPANKEIKIPPVDKATNMRYDSVSSNPNGTEINIVYENGRSYPEYLITYYTTRKSFIGGKELIEAYRKFGHSDHIFS